MKMNFLIHRILYLIPNISGKIIDSIFLRLLLVIIFKYEQTYSYDPQPYITSCVNLSHTKNYNNTPQIIIFFENTFPEECTVNMEESSVLLAIYNLTNTSSIWDFPPESFQTLIFPYVKTLDGFIRVIKSADRGGFTSAIYRWTLFLNAENETTAKTNSITAFLMDIIKNTKFGITNPLIIIRRQNSKKTNTKNCIIAFNLGTPKTKKQIKVFEAECLGTDQQQLHTLYGSKIYVAGVAHRQYEYDTKMGMDESNRTQFVSGFAVEILRGLQDILHFRAKPILMTDWGSQDSKSGEWAGMVGAAIKEEIDLAISSSRPNSQRAPLVDYNFETNKIVYACNKICRITEIFNETGNLITIITLTSLWITVAVWICISRLVYITFHHFLYTRLQREDSSSLSGGDLLPWIFVPITYRGIPKAPTCIALRTLYFTDLVVAVILNTVYSGTLISYLSIDYNPINSIGDLVNSEYNVEILNYSVTKQGLKNSLDTVVKSLYFKSEQYARPDKFTVTPIKELVNGKFAYVVHNMAGFKGIEEELNPLDACDLQYLPIKSQTFKQATFVPKGSKLKKIIDFGLLKMMETGLTSSFQQRYLSPKLLCAKTVELPPVDIHDLQLAFSMLIVAYVTTPFICLIENIWFDFQSKFRSNIYYLAYIHK